MCATIRAIRGSRQRVGIGAGQMAPSLAVAASQIIVVRAQSGIRQHRAEERRETCAIMSATQDTTKLVSMFARRSESLLAERAKQTHACLAPRSRTRTQRATAQLAACAHTRVTMDSGASVNTYAGRPAGSQGAAAYQTLVCRARSRTRHQEHVLAQLERSACIRVHRVTRGVERTYACRTGHLKEDGATRVIALQARYRTHQASATA